MPTTVSASKIPATSTFCTEVGRLRKSTEYRLPGRETLRPALQNARWGGSQKVQRGFSCEREALIGFASGEKLMLPGWSTVPHSSHRHSTIGVRILPAVIDLDLCTNRRDAVVSCCAAAGTVVTMASRTCGLGKSALVRIASAIV